MTSSILAGSMPLRATLSLMTMEPKSAADTLRNPPPKVPTAVLTGATMATPRICLLLVPLARQPPIMQAAAGQRKDRLFGIEPAIYYPFAARMSND